MEVERSWGAEKSNTTAEYDIRVDCPWYVLKNLSHANTYDSNEAYTQWICLLPAVGVVGKHKTIQFTVTCVTITIVQKTVILKSMLDLGRSFSCRLSAAFHQSCDEHLVTISKYLSPLVGTLFIFLLKRQWNYTMFFIFIPK